jgi:very-short-patch-repair endonuclease
MTTVPILAIAALAAKQHGVVTVPQLMELGATRHVITNLLASGQWERVTPLVLRRVGSPPSRGQRVIEAVLDAGEGAGLSHRSAAAWWRLRGFHLADIEVSRLRATRSSPARLARVVHEPRCFPPHHLTVLDGVPITVPSRIPFDLAATQPWLAAKGLDRAWTLNLLSYRSSMTMLDELSAKGRRGIVLMRELLAVRGPGYRPNDTNLEDRFQELARESGWHDLERQRNLLDREWLGRVDFLSRSRMIVIEVDSAFCHGALIDQEEDALRTTALNDAGYRVERFTDSEVWFEPAKTVERLRALRSGT